MVSLLWLRWLRGRGTIVIAGFLTSLLTVAVCIASAHGALPVVANAFSTDVSGVEISGTMAGGIVRFGLSQIYETVTYASTLSRVSVIAS